MSTVELAYNTDNKEFMAHAACQRWLTRKFYGEITPRELSRGLFICPHSLKVCEMKIKYTYIICYCFIRSYLVQF